MPKPKVAITYNPVVGGASVLSIQSVMRELDTEVVDADYRSIVPNSEDLASIYASEEKMQKVFKAAKAKAADFLKDIDCLILSGSGTMVDPRLYGEELDDKHIDLGRSIAELALIHVALSKGMPILGICGGHQILNIYLGGKLEELSSSGMDAQGFMDYAPVDIDLTSELAKILSPGSQGETSTEHLFGAHNEVVREPGGKGMIDGDKKDYLRVVARAHDPSQNIEAVEAQYGAPVMGLQFHPEVGAHGLRKFGDFRDMVYSPTSEIDIEKNRQIFVAFKKSAETFQRKKEMHKQLLGSIQQQEKKLSNPVRMKDTKISSASSSVEGKRENKPTYSSRNPFKVIANFLKWLGLTSIRKSIAKGLTKAKVRHLKDKENKPKEKKHIQVKEATKKKKILGDIFKDVRTSNDKKINEPDKVLAHRKKR